MVLSIYKEVLLNAIVPTSHRQVILAALGHQDLMEIDVANVEGDGAAAEIKSHMRANSSPLAAMTSSRTFWKLLNQHISVL